MAKKKKRPRSTSTSAFPLSLPFSTPLRGPNRDPNVPFRFIRVSSPISRIEIHGKNTPAPTCSTPTVRDDDSPLDARRRRRHRLCPRRGARARLPCPGLPRLRGRVQGRPVCHGHGEQLIPETSGERSGREKRRWGDFSLFASPPPYLLLRRLFSSSSSSPLHKKTTTTTKNSQPPSRPPSSPPSAPPSPSTATTPGARPPSPPSARRPTAGSRSTAATTSLAASRRTGELVVVVVEGVFSSALFS